MDDAVNPTSASAVAIYRPKLLGHVRDRTTLTYHPLHEQPPTMNIQTSVSVSHEGLQGR